MKLFGLSLCFYLAIAASQSPSGTITRTGGYAAEDETAALQLKTEIIDASYRSEQSRVFQIKSFPKRSDQPPALTGMSVQKTVLKLGFETHLHECWQSPSPPL